MEVMTHLVFQDGTAKAAVDRYVELVPGSGIERVVGDDGPGQTIRFTLAGRPFIAFDSPVKHAFEFTPAMSIYLDCDAPEDVDRIFAALSEGGEVFMPVDDYGFSTRYGWCTDSHGVSWQIGLRAEA